MAKNKKLSQMSARAVVNKLKIDSLPSFSFDASGDEIIPFGLDNIYPNRIYDAIQKSPTASGCVKRMNEFIRGNGVVGGDFPVNRLDETLNDVISQAIDPYTRYQGFCLHFNFNPFGQIIEITNVDFRFVRLLRNMKQAKISNWQRLLNRHYGYAGYVDSDDEVVINLYEPSKVLDQIKEAQKEGEPFLGQLFYWGEGDSIYPTSPLDSSNVAASYEHKNQIYQFANIENGFSTNTIIKYPSMGTGEDALDEEGNEIPYGSAEWREWYKLNNPAGRIQSELEETHGAENAGKSLVVTTPLNNQGDAKDFKMVEHLTPTNIDTLFVNQNAKAEQDILKTFTMPKILLGVSDQGMFNEASFNDAFNYKNADSEGDRKVIERIFNDKIISNSVYELTVEISPLEMKGKASDQGESQPTEEASIEKEEERIEKESQASLRGSVGGVQGVLQIQQSFSEGTTSFNSAISMLTIIYGFSEEKAMSLLGNPKKEEDV